MKKQFSKLWIRSKLPRKQRKYRANAPFNFRHKMMSANLSKELRKKYGRRNFPLRKGDEVRIMVGQFKKKSGKIGLVNLKKLKVSIEGINRSKKDGSKVNVWFDPSNLQVKELNLEDRQRLKSVNTKNTSTSQKKEAESKSNLNEQLDEIKIKEKKK